MFLNKKQDQKPKKWWQYVLISLASLIVLVGAVIVFFAKIEEIDAFCEEKKQAFFAICWNPTKVDFTQYEPLVDEENAWYTEYPLIAHACGGIDGKTYTNSKEALEQAFADGHKVIEADFLFTSDDELIVRHEWNQYLEQEDVNEENIPNLETFLASPIHYKYHALSFADMLQMLRDNPDVYLVTDVKGDNEYFLRAIQKMVDQAKETGFEDVLQQLIIQIYYEENYDEISAIYPFHNWIYTLYNSGTRDLNRVAQFCLEKDIHVVTMPVGWIESASYISVFEEMNIKIYTNTINSLNEVKSYRGRTVDGFYTDYIIPSDLEYIE